MGAYNLLHEKEIDRQSSLMGMAWSMCIEAGCLENSSKQELSVCLNWECPYTAY